MSDVFWVLALYHQHTIHDDDDDNGDDNDDVDNDDYLYDKVEFHVKLSPYKQMKDCVHHLLVFHLGSVLIIIIVIICYHIIMGMN